MNIGFIDSGVGGLSILKDSLKLLKSYTLPSYRYVYFADFAFLPYGNKSQNILLHRLHTISDYLIKQHDISCIVIACNTATCETIDQLRKQFNIHFIGVEPAIKPACLDSQPTKVYNLATTNTIKSKRYQELKTKHAKQHSIKDIACDQFVHIIENNIIGSQLTKTLNDTLSIVLQESKNTNPTIPYHIVLGCTHFPFLENQIHSFLKQRINNSIKFFHPGNAIANRIQFITTAYTETLPKKTDKVIDKITDIKRINADNCILSTLQCDISFLHSVGSNSAQATLEKQSKDMFLQPINEAYYIKQYLNLSNDLFWTAINI